MSKKHIGKLIHETLGLIGKNWSKADSTRVKLLSRAKDIARYMSREQGLNSIKHIKTKHVESYMRHLKDKGLEASSLQGYATTLRVIAQAIGKPNIVPNNVELGANRPNANRYKNATTPSDMDKLQEIKVALYQKSEWQGIAFEMQEKFGLRVKESLGSVNTVVHEGKLYLVVPAKLAKNGLVRGVEVKTPEQRELLQKAQALRVQMGTPGLIPAQLSLKQGYWKQVHAIQHLGGTKENLANSHSLRREYIRSEYAAIKMIPEKEIRDQKVQDLIEQVGHFDASKLQHYTVL
jgi:site-specific recombinase XerD